MKVSKKIVLIGHFGVGKSSLFRRFIDDTFSEDYKSSLGVQIQKKDVILEDGTKVVLILWDTEGHINIENNRPSFLKGADAFLYVFDLSRSKTFININSAIVFMQTNYPNTIFRIIGNKVDLVDKKEVQKELSQQKIPVDYYTSAKTAKNVERLFYELAASVVQL